MKKIKEKLKLTVLASQHSFFVSRNVLFGQENKNSNVDNFFQEHDKNPPTSFSTIRTLLNKTRYDLLLFVSTYGECLEAKCIIVFY